MKQRILFSFLFCLFITGVYSQTRYTLHGAHPRDISSAVILNPSNIILGCGFESAPQFEDYFSSYDCGLTWSVANSVSPTSQVMSLAFKDLQNGYGVCYKGKIVKTVDGGSTWTKTDTIARRNFLKIIYVNPQLLFIAGGSQANDTASVSEAPMAAAIGQLFMTSRGRRLNAIAFIDTLKGFAVGDSAQIFATTDGGNNWSPVYSPVGDRKFQGIAFTNVSTGYIIGGVRDTVGARRTILKTTDGGANWNIFKESGGKIK